MVKSIKTYLTDFFFFKLNDKWFSFKHIFDSISGTTRSPTKSAPTAVVFKETNSVASDDPFPDTLFPTTEPAIDKIVPQFTTPKHSVSGKIGQNH